MKNYIEMSDFEINRAVALGLGCKVRSSAFGTDYYFTDDDKAYNPCAPHAPVEDFNPCKSWDDAGPIIEKYSISLSKVKNKLTGGWVAEIHGESMSFAMFRDNNPLRAAMIVFLMMQEGK